MADVFGREHELESRPKLNGLRQAAASRPALLVPTALGMLAASKASSSSNSPGIGAKRRAKG